MELATGIQPDLTSAILSHNPHDCPRIIPDCFLYAVSQLIITDKTIGMVGGASHLDLVQVCLLGDKMCQKTVFRLSVFLPRASGETPSRYYDHEDPE